MRYSSTINNVKAKEWSLNIQQAYLFSWFYELPSWADKVVIGNDIFYFASKNKAVEELPILTSKKDTMYRYYKQIESLGLVLIKKIDGKDYVAITEKGKLWNYSKSDTSEINPSGLGNKSVSSSEINPTYNNIIINNKTSNKKNIEPATAKKAVEPQTPKEPAGEQKDLFGEKPNPNKKTLFKNSLVSDFKIFEKKLKEAGDQGVDLLYYYNSILDWSNIKNMKRTATGWVSTATQWMRQDREKSKLKMIQTTGEQMQNDQEVQEYLGM